MNGMTYNWYHVKLVSTDNFAGKRFYIESESEAEAEENARKQYGDEFNVQSLHISTVPSSENQPDGLDEEGTTNIAFDRHGNRL